MKLATWNVNSLKIRMPRVLEFLELHSPAVLFLDGALGHTPPGRRLKNLVRNYN